MWFQRLFHDYRKLQRVLPSAVANIMPLYASPSGKKLVDCLIIAEDHRNKYHIGVDVIAIVRALYKRIMMSSKEGASTIEQQLVRVITQDYQYSLSRKLKEIVLAICIRRMYNRKLLALSYLNIAFYGTLYQSLDAILMKYGLQKCDDIDLRTCASIVAHLKYPEPIEPSDYRISQLKVRENHILRLYLKNKKKNRFI